MLPKIHIEIEKWRFNKNYQIYVSNLGNFKDKSKETIKPKVEKGGYLAIPLCNNKKGIIKYIQAHRIVMETWCPRAEMWKEKLTVDHLDHNKRNNKCSNLEWVTMKENSRRAAADSLYDNKDAIIQSLKDRIRNLECLLDTVNCNISISCIGIKDFNNWDSVFNYLYSLNPNIKNMKMKNLVNRIKKASRTNTKYMGYKWKIN